jgi:hypothetical protein
VDFLHRFSQNSAIANFEDIPPAAAELIKCVWAEGRMDVAKLMGDFRDYAKARETLIQITMVFVTLSYCI